ncbi:flagellar basal body rod protein [Halalkalibacillus sediminis]|uniref:Flagellar basal body rod protein n=1 Tax=Halalkalibacillus sediminis TaxID=2018042 RepID=A0A2I0QTS7_9BACI|nr:flagellar basal body rod protein [Halalkalibacillus sediminis]PKR77704.1 flagellar basal body rod protein [Halalkalibacillus sediminis]
MPKWLWIVLAIVLAIVVLANLGPMIVLGLALWFGYLLLRKWFRTDSTSTKVLILVVGAILVSIAIANSYAIIGIAAAYGLYVMYQKKDDVDEEPENDDPFTNFENQWKELSKY